MRPAFFSGFIASPSGAGDISLDFVIGESILQTTRSGYHQRAVDGCGRVWKRKREHDRAVSCIWICAAKFVLGRYFGHTKIAFEWFRQLSIRKT